MTESWKNVLGFLESPGILCKPDSGNPIHGWICVNTKLCCQTCHCHY